MLVRFLKSFTPNTFINTQHIKTIECYYIYCDLLKRWTPNHPKPEGKGVFDPEYLKSKRIPNYFQEGDFVDWQTVFYFIDDEGNKLTPEEFIGEERLNNYKQRVRSNKIDYAAFLKEGSALSQEGFKIVVDFASTYSVASIGAGRTETDSMAICFKNIDDCIEAAERLKQIIGFEEI